MDAQETGNTPQTENVAQPDIPLNCPEPPPPGPEPLMQAELPLPLLKREGEHDVFDLGNHILVVVTDRVVVFGKLLPAGIPDKGIFSTRLSHFWLGKTGVILPNTCQALVSDTNQLNQYLAADQRFEYPDYLANRSLIFRKTDPLNIECEIWGYLTGHVWQEYKNHGTVFGNPTINGLLESQAIPGFAFAAFRKNPDGTRTQINDEEMNELAGAKAAGEIRSKTFDIYNQVQRNARIPGNFFIANIKLEFGLEKNKPFIINDILSPDNSCYWDIRTYRVGREHFSFETQTLKAWLMQSSWSRKDLFPTIPPEIMAQTVDKYRQLCERITGIKAG
ncbi:MAG: hypothetical protein JW954_00700 [Dehalococcoidaceae bacterium]|nr:hypothetical protein [Dehalococcoidaceae bacterium]